MSASSTSPAPGTLLIARYGTAINLTTSVTGGDIQLAVLGTTQTRGQIPIVRPAGSGVQLRLAQQYVFSDTQLPFLTFPANALSTGDASLVITATVSVSEDSLSWVNVEGLTLPAGTAVTASNLLGTGRSLTLTGTASALNTWLSTAGNLAYTGTRSATLTFAINATSSVGGPVAVSTIPSSLIIRPAATPTVSLSAPDTLTLAPAASGASTVAFSRDLIAASGGTGALTLTLVAPVGGSFVNVFNDDTVSANADGVAVTSALTVSVNGVSRNAVQLAGSATDLNRYLRAVGNLSYSGTGGQSLEMPVTNPGTVSGMDTTSTARILLDNPGARAIPRLALPSAVTLVPGADAPLLLGAADGTTDWLLGVPSNTTNGSAALMQATITASGGVLTTLDIVSTLPGDFTGDTSTAEIQFHAPSRTLYVSNRGLDKITLYRVDAKTGAVKLLGWAPCHGREPRYFGIDPNGRYLYCANARSDTIVRFSIDPKTGQLKKVGKPIPSLSSVTIAFTAG